MTTSLDVSDTRRPRSLCLKPLSMGQTCTSSPLLKPSGSLWSTLSSASANSAARICFTASAPLSRTGLGACDLAAETAFLKRPIQEKTLGNCVSDMTSDGKAPLSSASQWNGQTAMVAFGKRNSVRENLGTTCPQCPPRKPLECLGSIPYHLRAEWSPKN